VAVTYYLSGPAFGMRESEEGWPKRTHEYTAIITWQRQTPSDISKKDKVITVHDALLCIEPFTHAANMLPIIERCYWLDKFPSFCNNHKKGKPDAGGKLASQDTGGLDQLEYRFLSERISLENVIQSVHVITTKCRTCMRASTLKTKLYQLGSAMIQNFYEMASD